MKNPYFENIKKKKQSCFLVARESLEQNLFCLNSELQSQY